MCDLRRPVSNVNSGKTLADTEAGGAVPDHYKPEEMGDEFAALGAGSALLQATEERRSLAHIERVRGVVAVESAGREGQVEDDRSRLGRRVGDQCIPAIVLHRELLTNCLGVELREQLREHRGDDDRHDESSTDNCCTAPWVRPSRIRGPLRRPYSVTGGCTQLLDIRRTSPIQPLRPALWNACWS